MTTFNPPQDFEVALARKILSMSSNLLSTFRKLDVDSDGYVTRSDLKIALHNVFGIDLTRYQMDGLFARFAYFEKDHRDDAIVNTTRHGIKYTEFVQYISHTAQSGKSYSSSSNNVTLLQQNDQDEQTETSDRKSGMYSNLLLSSSSSEEVSPDLRHTIGRLLSQKSGEDMKNTHLFLDMDIYRNSRVSPEEFRKWFLKQGLMITENQVKVILGKHYKQQMEMDEFVELVNQLRNYNSVDIDLNNEDLVFEEKDQSLVYIVARQSLVNSIHQCVDDAKTDKAIVKIVAEQLYSKKKRLLDTFHKWDLDGSGKLDVKEFHQALKALDLDISEERARSLITTFDEDGDGNLDKIEFMRFINFSLEEEDSSLPSKESLKRSIKGHEDQNKYGELINQLDSDDFDAIMEFRKAIDSERLLVSKAFQALDKDRSGYLDFEELKAGFIKMKVQVSDDHLKHIMNRFDSEGKGKLAFHQFLKLISSNLED